MPVQGVSGASGASGASGTSGVSGSPTDSYQNLRIVSWNIQNLFDSEWQGTEYPEYDPRPPKNNPETSSPAWGEAGYRYRIKSLAAVLDRLDADILALTEIENDNALSQLNLQLRKPYPYRLLLPQKDQAVHSALLSRIPILRSLRHDVGFDAKRKLRAIIEVHLENKFILFLNHWKSQREGYYETLAQRKKAAAVLAARLLDLPFEYVLILGDFNEPVDSFFRYTDSSFRSTWWGFYSPWFAYDQGFENNSLDYDEAFQTPVLTDISEQSSSKLIRQGSYYFRGRWQAIDNIFISPNFQKGLWKFSRFSVPRFAPLVRQNGLPNAWRKEIMSGISDHLPLLLELQGP
ncbi:MAG: endonuclease/exonuclease/phosphatase family protein [Spirochaetota bacterium]